MKKPKSIASHYRAADTLITEIAFARVPRKKTPTIGNAISIELAQECVRLTVMKEGRFCVSVGDEDDGTIVENPEVALALYAWTFFKTAKERLELEIESSVGSTLKASLGLITNWESQIQEELRHLQARALELA